MYSSLLLQNEIEIYNNSTRLYSIKLSYIGESDYFKAFELAIVFIVNFFLKCISIALSVIVVYKFKDYFKSAKREIDRRAVIYTPSQLEKIYAYENKRKRTEKKMLNLVITMTALYVVSRTFQSSYVLISVFNPDEKARGYVILQAILINICYISIYSIGGLNVVVLCIFSKKFRVGFIHFFKLLFAIILEILRNYG